MSAKILLIDDDADDRELFCEALEDVATDVVCHTVPNGHEAFLQLDRKEAATPDLIFLDINMPVMNGWQCLEVLKDHDSYKHIPVIMYSTSSYPEDIHRAWQLGALCFFSKPADYEQLKASMRVVVFHLINDTLQSLGLSSPVFLTQ